MKKALLLVAILFVSVISTACVNNLAIQELNNAAKTYMDEGKYEEAIERLKSSIDLAPDMYETRYNLAVAYTKVEDYDNAIKQYAKAIELKPSAPDSYYSLAVCQENLAKDIIKGQYILDEQGLLVKAPPVELNQDYAAEEKEELSPQLKSVIVELLKGAMANYDTYAKKIKDPDQIQEVNDRFADLNEMVQEYSY